MNSLRNLWKLGLLVYLIITPVFAEDIILASDEWCPFNCEVGSDQPGILIEIAKEAFSKAGYNVVYQVMPWSRAIEVARRGEIHGVIGAIKDDVPDFIFPEFSVVKSENSFYVLQDSNWKYEGISSLKSVSLGAIRDYAYVKELNEYIKVNSFNSQKVQLSSGDDALEINIKKLLAKRIDVLVEDANVMGYVMHKNNLKDKIKYIKGDPARDSLHVAFSPSPKIKNSKDLAGLITSEMKALENTPKLKAMFHKYGIE